MIYNKKYALLAVGELLGDFLGTEITESLLEAKHFARFQGGSPANLASNMARLGLNTAIVSCVGNENLGKYLVTEVAKTGVDTSNVIFSDTEPTSIVIVSRTTSTPDFIPYRTADKMLLPSDLPDELLSQVAIFHTTCWPLSMNPSQNTVLDAAKRAKKLGCLLSADLNYAPRVWPNRAEAHEVIKAYLSNGAIIKMSDDDAERFYGKTIAMEEVLDDFHSWGADLICFTLGKKGSLISIKGNPNRILVPGKEIEVVDSTGAGDSYWAGFLTAYLKGESPETCAKAGANLAALKLQTLGPMAAKIDISILWD